MIEKIKNKLEHLQQEALKQQEAIKNQFDDPIAKNTNWFPLKRGGSNFQTQKLTVKPNGQIKVDITKGNIAFTMLFVIIGVGAILVAFNGLLQIIPMDMEPLNFGQFIMLLIFGGLFLLPGILVFRPRNRYTFDKSQNYCWRGSKSPREVIDINTDDFIELERIKGLQIISERIRSSSSSGGSNRSYNSYELNLILDNGDRINVMDHGKQSAIRADAKKLSEYLNIPVFEPGRTG